MSNFIDFIYAIVLGIVEGLTEFLPVSSTGHLILTEALLNYKAPETFDTMIQLGAILAVCVLYFQKLWQVVLDLPSKRQAQMFALGIIIAFLPAMIIGYLGHDFIKAKLFNPIVVSISLIIGGLIIIIAETYRPEPKIKEVDDIDLITALKIGLVQCCAMIPGVSRSGATIIGAMFMGVERKAAAEFSFFLAIPTMLGVFVYEAYKGREELLGQGGHDLAVVGVGFVVSFISAILVIKPFLNIVTKIGFTPFAWYRIAAGILMLGYFTIS
jgi:undecaprenyl-diphosphatase